MPAPFKARQIVSLSRDYLGPSLDTTIFATANLIWLFSQNPDQWNLLRADLSLIRKAISNTLCGLASLPLKVVA